MTPRETSPASSPKVRRAPSRSSRRSCTRTSPAGFRLQMRCSWTSRLASSTARTRAVASRRSWNQVLRTLRPRAGDPLEGWVSSDVIIGYHGKPRCAWAGVGDTAFGRYHDEVWGTRTYDESAMFEALTLGVFEVGLSWSIVFGKRDAFRTAFWGFDVAKVAAMTEQDVDRLTEDASIIRNRGKIQAPVDNARAMMSASPNLV